MITDNIKNLICSILVVLLLLGVCMTVDYADENITLKSNQTPVNESNCTLINGTYYDNKMVNQTVVKANSYSKVHYVHPVIGMYAKPSCGCKYSYRWHYREFVNYCPNCHHYGTLRRNPKGTHEKEYTCRRCDSDFCGVCGKEKYIWSRVYLRRP